MADSALKSQRSEAVFVTVAMLVVLASEKGMSTTSMAYVACFCLEIFWAAHACSYLAGHGHPFLVRLMGLMSLMLIYNGWRKPSTSKAASLCLAFLWAGQAMAFNAATRPVYFDAASAALDGSASLQPPGLPWQAEGFLSVHSCWLFSGFIMVRVPLSAHR